MKISQLNMTYGQDQLSTIKKNFFHILSLAKDEVFFLRTAIIEGRIEGSVYQGECSCLIGTIAIARKVSYRHLKGITPYVGNPAESFFLSIKKGDTPENSSFSKQALDWVNEFILHHNLTEKKET